MKLLHGIQRADRFQFMFGYPYLRHWESGYLLSLSALLFFLWHTQSHRMPSRAPAPSGVPPSTVHPFQTSKSPPPTPPPPKRASPSKLAPWPILPKLRPSLPRAYPESLETSLKFPNLLCGPPHPCVRPKISTRGTRHLRSRGTQKFLLYKVALQTTIIVT